MAACPVCQRKRLSDSDRSDLNRRKSTRGDFAPSTSQAADFDGPNVSTAAPPQPQQQQQQQDAEVEAPPTPEQRTPAPVSPSRIEQQSAHLLLKACEREEEAEGRAEEAAVRAEEAERELAAVSDKLQRSEEALAAAQERIKLLELQVLDRCSGRLSDAPASEVRPLLGGLL